MKRTVVFIHIPKNAGSSIQEAFGFKKYRYKHRLPKPFTDTGLITFGHIPYKSLVNEGYISKEWDSKAFKFAIIRNPLDRMVSLYSYSLKIGTVPSDTSFLEYCRMIDTLDFNTRSLQSVWIDGVSMNFLGCFDRLETDLKRVCDQLDIDYPKLPKLNTTYHQEWEKYYCDESIEIVRVKYQKDIKLWESL